MPLFGAHLSIAGGHYKAAEEAGRLGMETVQLFTAAPSSWQIKPDGDGWAGKLVSADAAAAFKAAVAAAGLRYPTVHDSYLINLAAAADAQWEKSVAAFAHEITQCERLGVTYVVTHPGAHVGSGEDAGLKRVAAGLDEAFARHPAAAVTVLLETTAGQGTCLGHRFEHLAELLSACRSPERLGVCLDTCHVFAAGYGLGTDAEYDATFEEFDRVVGLSHLKLFHVNDSAKPRGSRVDRHAGIGLGQIGDLAFRRLVTDPRFAELPMVLETPKEDADGNPMDAVNLAKLRGFAAASGGAGGAGSVGRTGGRRTRR